MNQQFQDSSLVYKLINRYKMTLRKTGNKNAKN